MNQVVARHPGKQIHVILDNLSTHKPKRDTWLARHPNVHLHYTPTHASWLNQIEVWISILASKSLKGGSFGSVRELVDHIDSFIASYNDREPTGLRCRHISSGSLWDHLLRVHPCSGCH
jgi:transposase